MATLGISQVSFTGARFDDSGDVHECYIVSSTGNYLVTWNLKRVLDNADHRYEIKRMNDRIVDNDFKYSKYPTDEKQLVVTLPNDIQVQRTRKITRL